jgi:hypothetical protein
LLQDTGIEYRFIGSSTLLLQLPTATMSIDVTGTAPVVSTSLSKYQQPLEDTPQTIDVVP